MLPSVLLAPSIPLRHRRQAVLRDLAVEDAHGVVVQDEVQQHGLLELGVCPRGRQRHVLFLLEHAVSVLFSHLAGPLLEAMMMGGGDRYGTRVREEFGTSVAWWDKAFMRAKTVQN